MHVPARTPMLEVQDAHGTFDVPSRPLIQRMLAREGKRMPARRRWRLLLRPVG
jgi:hypothetical protein